MGNKVVSILFVKTSIKGASTQILVQTIDHSLRRHVIASTKSLPVLYQLIAKTCWPKELTPNAKRHCNYSAFQTFIS